MGKQRQKDKLYITPKEWKQQFGGHKLRASTTNTRRIGFDHCALSFAPVQDPVCTPSGVIYDLGSILTYLKKNRCDPVSGAELKLNDLIKVHFHKNGEGNYHCPLSYKQFTDNTKIAIVKPSGNAYSYEAIQKLNIDSDTWKDLISGDPFNRSDIIVINDPSDESRKAIGEFFHVKNQSVLVPSISKTGSFTGKRLQSTASEIITEKSNTAPIHDHVVDDAVGHREVFSSGMCAASFTSSMISPVTQNKQVPLTIKQIRDKLYIEFKEHTMKIQKRKSVDVNRLKAFVCLSTNFGDINVMVHCDLVPATCDNFLTLCERGYYTGTKFHRLIPGFMVQAGCPEGTGRGGSGAYSNCIDDEIDYSLLHNSRGVLSMANKGYDTGSSQFFFTFGPAKHLDGHHAIFGCIVGGMDTLDRIEAIPVGEKDLPMTDIIIIGCDVLNNPIRDFEHQNDGSATAEATNKVKAYWGTLNLASKKNPDCTSRIGKYIKQRNIPVKKPRRF